MGWWSIRPLLVHIVATAVTGWLIFMTFSRFYAWDQREEMDGEYFKPSLNALQFAAKIHEILIVGSLAAILMHHIRNRLLGHRGIPLGLLGAGFQTSSVEYLFSSSLWSNVTTNWRFTSVIALSIVFANAVGPSSAILMIPTLNWWPAKNPYAWQMTLLMSARSEDVYPLSFGPDIPEDEICLSLPFSSRCTAAGFDTIQSWADSVSKTTADVNVTLYGDSTNIEREMYVVGFNSGNQALGVTLTQAITDLYGHFWFMIQDLDIDTGNVRNYTHPRLQSGKESQVYGPASAVECAEYDFLDARHGIVNVSLPGTNISVDHTLWDMDQPLDSTTFTWLDVPDEAESAGLDASIAALAKVPYSLWHQAGNGTEVPSQQSKLIACTVSAHWTATSVALSPKSGRKITHNVTDPSVFLSEKYMSLPTNADRDSALARDFGLSPTIKISAQWARRLNLPLKAAGNLTAAANLTAVASILGQFVHPAPLSPATSAQVFNFDMWQGIHRAGLVAKTLALLVSDGLAMHAVSTARPLVAISGLDADAHASSSSAKNYPLLSARWRGAPILSINKDDNTTAAEELEGEKSAEEVDAWLAVPPPEVYRFGYGYGFLRPSKTVFFALAVLGLHAAVALAHLCRLVAVACCGCGGGGRRGGESSRSWGQLGELFALALVSSPAREELGSVGAGVGERRTWRKAVRVKDDGRTGAEMAVQSMNRIGRELESGKKYN